MDRLQTGLIVFLADPQVVRPPGESLGGEADSDPGAVVLAAIGGSQREQLLRATDHISDTLMFCFFSILEACNL